MRIFKCNLCGNIIEMINDSGVNVVCCGEEMTELIPGQTDGAHEKHVPVVTCHNDKICVKVGEVPHPMENIHFIEWIAIETTTGVHRTMLTPQCKPHVEFTLAKGEDFVAAYAYCNQHGLWKCM